MRTVLSTLILASAAAASAAASDASTSEREAQNLARYEPYAGAPIGRIDNFDLLRYEMVGPSYVLVWSKRPGDVFLLSFREPCRELESAQALALRTSSRTLRAGIDFVEARGRSCFIEQIRPIDERAMRAAKG